MRRRIPSVPGTLLTLALAIATLVFTAGCASSRESNGRDPESDLARLRENAERELAEVEGRGQVGTGKAYHPWAERPRPQWVPAGLSEEYPITEYIVGIGSAQGIDGADHAALSAAEDRARSAIAKTIRVRIQSEFRSAAELVTSTVSGERLLQKDTTSVFNKITSRADLVLEGAQIVDRWLDREANTYWALAALNREAAGETILERMDALAEKIASDQRLGSEFRERGNAFQALRYLNRAVNQSYGLLNYRAQLRAISPKHAEGISAERRDTGLPSLWREAALAAEGLRFGVLLFAEATGRRSDPGRVQAEFSRALRSLGLNTVKLPPPGAVASYADLKKMPVSELRERLDTSIQGLVLAQVEAKHVASERLVRRVMHFYQARAEGLVLDLNEGRVLASAGFDWSAGTHTAETEAPRAAEGALLKAASQLGDLLRTELAAELAIE